MLTRVSLDRSHGKGARAWRSAYLERFTVRRGADGSADVRLLLNKQDERLRPNPDAGKVPDAPDEVSAEVAVPYDSAATVLEVDATLEAELARFERALLAAAKRQSKLPAAAEVPAS